MSPVFSGRYHDEPRPNMTLSGSRQQFLAYESHNPEAIHYERRGGLFVTTCVCISFIILAVIVAVLVGVIVYFITYFKLSQKPDYFWDDAEPFGDTKADLPDMRLPSHVVPSFYRLKLKADVEKSTFTGDVSITIKANKAVKKIVLHSKNLSINNSARLTEQIYEKVGTVHKVAKREVDAEANNTSVTETPKEINITNTTPETLDNNVTSNSLSTTTTSNAIENSTVPFVIMTSKSNGEKQVTHSSVKKIKIMSINQEPGDRLVLNLATPLKTGVDYILELSFYGNISSSLLGFYQSTYLDKDQKLRQTAVTQFQPISARAAFPCFDEPQFKAKFEISIAHARSLSALSNMKITGQEDLPELPDWQWTHFERSVNMSTYLVAYVISDFKYLETSYNSKDNITKPIRVWAREELLPNAKYALSITPKLLEFYEEVFGVPYVLDKLDLVAVTDFANGAMENWGLITFRESCLLLNESQAGPAERQEVAVSLAHELAHQWFGNLVTMTWWTDLWLNEGFASYMEFVAVDKIEPSWDVLSMFSDGKMQLMRTDVFKHSSAVTRQASSGAEIAHKFDEISYAKASNLIRMLNNTITAPLFSKGLVIYLNEWKFRNAEENDLWLSMTAATQSDVRFKDLSVVKFMNSWTRQQGLPVVNVTRDYENERASFEQHMLTIAADPDKETKDPIWQIPITYANLGAPTTWSTEPKFWLNDRSVSLALGLSEKDALYVNVDGIGYYRVNYDHKNWELLRGALAKGEVTSPIARTQLIDDALNLAKASQLNYSYALDLITFVRDGEDSKNVWEMLLDNMNFLRFNLRATSGFVYFQDFVKLLLEKKLKQVNYGLDKPKDDREALFLERLLTWECLAESPRCLNWAKKSFDDWAAQPDLTNNTIPVHLRSLVFNMAVKHGGRREFDAMWRLYQETTDPAIKGLALGNLATTQEESLLTMLLEKSLTELPKNYATTVWNVDAPVGDRLTREFFYSRFEAVHAKFTQMDGFMFAGVLSGAFNSINTVEELNRLKTFAMKHKEQFMPLAQTLQKIIDRTTMRIGWIARNAHEVNKWFKDYVTKNAGSTKTDSTHPATTEKPIEDQTRPTTVPPPNETTKETTSSLLSLVTNTATAIRNSTG